MLSRQLDRIRPSAGGPGSSRLGAVGMCSVAALESAEQASVEPLGGGQYETVDVRYWELRFGPQMFFCACAS